LRVLSLTAEVAGWHDSAARRKATEARVEHPSGGKSCAIRRSDDEELHIVEGKVKTDGEPQRACPQHGVAQEQTQRDKCDHVPDRSRSLVRGEQLEMAADFGGSTGYSPRFTHVLSVTKSSARSQIFDRWASMCLTPDISPMSSRFTADVSTSMWRRTKSDRGIGTTNAVDSNVLIRLLLRNGILGIL